MRFTQTTYAGNVEILASKDYQAIPIKVAAPESGTVVKAGSPLTAAGAITTSSNAKGILLYDVDTAANPNGALVVQGIIDSEKAQSHSGLTYDSGLMTALNAAGCSIVMRDDIRALRENAALSALSVGTLTLTPTFTATVYTYTASTTHDTDDVTATAADANAAIVIKNGSTTVTNGSAATWDADSNTVKVTVTAEDGKTTAEYTVTVAKT